jgi:serine/threonine protein kinase
MEPIPGYCLTEKIGDGGFGEVWKVTAPGGLFKALKIVYGNLSGPRAEQELKALERIKAVRHPFLLSLERFEVVDDRLLIVTELADRSLFDRFTECRAAGLRGVPREELLGYLRDAADALDYLSETHSLQHLDIKPQNLLLLSGRIKVADFGLVKNLMGTSATITGGVTPVYAAPEVFEGRVSRFSDQYSLAIAYQELLTSVRPFPGATPFQLAAQHSSARPFLSPLPATDQPVVARALSKVPERRFPSCRGMVELLARPAAAPAPAARPAVAPSPLMEEDEFSDKPTAPFPEARDPLGIPELSESTPHSGETWSAFPAADSETGGLRPTLFVGIGGAGSTTLRLLRRRLRCRLGDAAALPIFQMLLLDTDRASIRSAQEGSPDEALTPEETLLCPLKTPDGYRSQSQTLLRWLDRRWLHGIPRSLRPEGIRPLGRLALLDNAEAVLGRLRKALSQLAGASAQAVAVGATGRALRDSVPRVFVVASVAGGTGGGMLWDVAYAVRQVLGELNVPDTGVCGLLLHATASSPDQQVRTRVNTWATLLELEHWCRPDVSFPGAPEYGLAGFAPGRPPFDDCYLAHLGDGLTEDRTTAETDRVAEYLCLDASAGGACLDRLRQESRWPWGLRSFGLAGVNFARGALVDRASNLLCRRVVLRCLGDGADDDHRAFEEQANRQIGQLGLGLNMLVDRLFKTLGESLIAQPGPARASIAAADPHRPTDNQSLVQLLQEVEDELNLEGAPGRQPEADARTAKRTLLENARNDAEQVGRTLVEWLLDMVEDPDSRLRAAECSLDSIIPHLRRQVDEGRARLARCRVQCQNLRRQLLKMAEGSHAGALRWIDFRRLYSSRCLSQSESFVWDYLSRRQEEAALEGALTVLEGVCARLAPLQDLKVCRQRVYQLADLFSDGSVEGDSPAAGLTPLMPFGADKLASAAEALVEQFDLETIRGLEAQFQAEVLDLRGGLFGVIGDPLTGSLTETLASSTAVAFWDMSGAGRQLAAELREQLFVRAQSVVVAALGNADAAGLFLERHGDSEQARQAIVAFAGQARSRLSQANAGQYALLALPASRSAETLRDLATETLVGLPLTVVEGYEGVVFVQETAGLSIPAVITSLCGDDSHCADLAVRVLTRIDVHWSGLNGESLEATPNGSLRPRDPRIIGG